MLSVKCEIQLLKDQKRRAFIQMYKAPKGNLWWKVIRSAGGNLSLSAPEGNWEINSGEMLSFWYKPGKNEKTTPFGLITLFVPEMKENFLDEMIRNGASINGKDASLYNDNPAEKDVSCNFSRMY